ncbi:MAG: phospholipase D-like domain-containing protein [Polaromonas sp.]|uniref:phospholipase D-like domain-containing protein n=1 Tax=Polaromonas sp. TaxID=1869339 RepID=UPI0032637E80
MQIRHLRVSPWLTGLLTFIAALAAFLLALNFSVGEKKVRQQLTRHYSVADPQFHRAMGSLLGPGIVGGNQAAELLNGDQIFPAMLGAIRSATRTITFETYIYWSGEIGKQFADALSERSRAGVKVHILVDWVGSAKMDEDLLKEMVDAGVDIHKFHKPAWYNFAKLNNRTHRKLLVVDGAVGFTGGVGIAPKWTGNGQDAEHWRDSHYRVEGPVVAQMQSTFLDNWLKVSGQVLHGEPYFPEIKPVGSSLAQMFSSSPTSGSENVELMYHLALTASAKTIDLSMAYFVPDEVSIDILLAAMRRGVRLRLITPGKIIDTETVRAASRATWGKLLEAGAEIYEFQPSMYHCKVMIVDGLMVSVGSTNFDSRSFKLNDEANLNIYDAAFAARQTQVFEQDLQKSRRVTLQDWKNRPLSEKLSEKLASLLNSQL